MIHMLCVLLYQVLLLQKSFTTKCGTNVKQIFPVNKISLWLCLAEFLIHLWSSEAAFYVLFYGITVLKSFKNTCNGYHFHNLQHYQSKGSISSIFLYYIKFFIRASEAHSGPSQTSNMEIFAKIVNSS